MADREFSWLESDGHEECLRDWLKNQCLGFSDEQWDLELRPVAGERDEVPGGVRCAIHFVASATIDRCRFAFVRLGCLWNHYFQFHVAVFW